MEATLKIKNVDANPVDIEPDGGDALPVTIAPNADADVGGQLLSGRSFRALMASGKVRFVETANPTAAQYGLARRVIPRLMQQVGGPIAALASLLAAAKDNLEDKRFDYNHRHSAAGAVIQDGKDTALSADYLYRGCNHFVNTKLEEEIVTQLEADIAVLEAEDLAVTNRTLEEWYADREARQDELEAAQKAFEVAEGSFIVPLASLKQAVKDASAFTAADPNTDIGVSLPPFP